MDRNPVVAGRFYQGTPDSLQDEIKRFVDAESPKERVIGMVSPHAGYFYSGPVAGATFSRVKFT
ncbi:MAG: AmmeMemoRadiSam system protein B, partial [Chloroflexota bacterium]|nr:AmmeMemoRadiSam system protein B [Chloroflexota bacterium]